MLSKRAGVIVILSLAATACGLVIPALGRIHARAVSEGTKDRIGKLAMALHTCQNAQTLLPPAFDAFTGISYPASVHMHLLPYLQQDELYQSFQKEGGGKTDATIATFQAIEDGSLGNGAGVQNFAANLRIFADVAHQHQNYDNKPLPLTSVMPGHARIPHSFVCGTSSTMVFATKFAACTQPSAAGGHPIAGGSCYNADPTSPYAAFFGENAATKPAHASDPEATFQLAPRRHQARVWPLMAQSFSSRGILVAMGDGSAHMLGPEMSPDSWNYALQAYKGGGGLGPDW